MERTMKRSNLKVISLVFAIMMALVSIAISETPLGSGFPYEMKNLDPNFIADGFFDLGVIQLGNALALRTDQELAGVVFAGVGAAGVGIEAFNAMN